MAFLIACGATGAEALSPLQEPADGVTGNSPDSAAQQVEAQPQASSEHARSTLDLRLPERGSFVPAPDEKKPSGNTGQGPSSQGTAIDPWFPGRGLGVQVTTNW